MRWPFTREANLIFAAILGGVIAVLAAAIAWDAHSCAQIGEMMGVESHHTFATGCMIKTDGKWQPLFLIKKAN